MNTRQTYLQYIPGFLFVLILCNLLLLNSCNEEGSEADFQGALSGRVVDIENGEPVEDAIVSLNGQERGSQTVESDGLYSFDNLIPGTYTIQASHPLYETNSVRITVRSQESSDGDVTLKPLGQIAISPSVFDFGDLTPSFDLSLKNLGSDAIEFKIESTQGWLSADKTSVLVPGKNEVFVKIAVNRNLLDFGQHTAVVLVNIPDKDSKTIPISVSKNNVNKAVLFVEEEFIDFSSKLRFKDIVIENIGDNSLDWELTTDQDWLSVSKVTGLLNADSNEEIEIFCDRSQLDDGVYEGTLLLTSNGGNKSIGVKTEVISGSGSPDEIVVSVGLRTYYTFNSGVGVDELNNFPVLEANAYLSTDSSSLDGYYLNFEGNGSYMELDGNPLFNQNPGVVHGAISLWLRTNVGGALVAVPYQSTPLFNEFVAGFNNTTFIHSVSNSSDRACCVSDYGIYPANAGSLLVDFEWHHVVLVYKGDTEETFIYVDGVEISRSFYEFYPFLSRAMDANTLIIGSDYSEIDTNPGIFDFEGHMDNIRIYNRPLSASEVKEIFEAEK
ncbi:MAG: carboxypeptidase regulatory-like domain-containing protein [Bacteroidota bacterium]